MAPAGKADFAGGTQKSQKLIDAYQMYLYHFATKVAL
jgi:hypothetical protein